MSVSGHGDEYCMDFPAQKAQVIDIPKGLLEALGITHGVVGVWKAADLIVLVDDKTMIDGLSPHFNALNVLIRPA